MRKDLECHMSIHSIKKIFEEIAQTEKFTRKYAFSSVIDFEENNKFGVVMAASPTKIYGSTTRPNITFVAIPAEKLIGHIRFVEIERNPFSKSRSDEINNDISLLAEKIHELAIEKMQEIS